ESFGMPMGPIELADTVGLDICLHVAETLKASLDRPMPDVSRVLADKVEMGHLGRKSGRGFYEWRRRETGKERQGAEPQEGEDGPPHSSHARRLRHLSARGRGDR